MKYKRKMNEELKTLKNDLNILLTNKNNGRVLYKWLKTELAYTSNGIEGNTLTRKETALVIEEDLTSSSKPLTYYLEAKNHAKAFDRILEIKEKNLNINEKEILNIHRIILAGIDDMNAGFYRNCRVRISGSNVILPNPLKVPLLMQAFAKWLGKQDLSNPETAFLAHLKLVSIHPFVDGNGRCARLLMNALLLKAGFVPVIIRKIDRKRYLQAIEKAQLTQNTADYIRYMQKALIRSMKSAMAILDISKEDISQNKLYKIAEFAKAVNLPVSTVRYRVKKGKIKPYAYTNSGYMLFSEEQIKQIKHSS